MARQASKLTIGGLPLDAYTSLFRTDKKPREIGLDFHLWSWLFAVLPAVVFSFVMNPVTERIRKAEQEELASLEAQIAAKRKNRAKRIEIAKQEDHKMHLLQEQVLKLSSVLENLTNQNAALSTPPAAQAESPKVVPIEPSQRSIIVEEILPPPIS